MPGSYGASTALPFRLNVILGIRRMIAQRAWYHRRVHRNEAARLVLGGRYGGPWNPGKPTNGTSAPGAYLPEVRKNDRFAPKIKIHDVTLRDGEQQTAVVFRREEKVAIAKQLDALGVHRIEAGMPAVSEQDKAAISGHRRARA